MDVVLHGMSARPERTPIASDDTTVRQDEAAKSMQSFHPEAAGARKSRAGGQESLAPLGDSALSTASS